MNDLMMGLTHKDKDFASSSKYYLIIFDCLINTLKKQQTTFFRYILPLTYHIFYSLLFHEKLNVLFEQDLKRGMHINGLNMQKVNVMKLYIIFIETIYFFTFQFIK